MHVGGNAGSIVDYAHRSNASLARRGKEHVPGTGIPGVSQKLDHGVFHAADVVLCLASFGLGHT
jgi:hypothetical protein